MKKKLFTTNVTETAILVQYTRRQGELSYKKVEDRGGEDPRLLPTSDATSETEENQDDDCEFIFIRKFRSVADFVERVRTLDTVLENIESFTSDVNSSTTPTASRPSPLLIEDLPGAKSPTQAASQQIVEEPEQTTPDCLSPYNNEPRKSEINICCICMERQIERVLTCFHAYCLNCIDGWKQRDPTCPLCRSQENGRGSFDLLSGPDPAMIDQIKQDLMRGLSRLVGELLGEAVDQATLEDSLGSSASP